MNEYSLHKAQMWRIPFTGVNISVYFAPRALFVGVYLDRINGVAYICPIPTLVIQVDRKWTTGELIDRLHEFGKCFGPGGLEAALKTLEGDE